MKRNTIILIIISIFIIPLTVLGQVDPMALPIPPYDSVDGKRNYYYEEIVKLKDEKISKQKIYQVTKLAIVSIFNSNKDIIQLEDSSNGNIVAKVYTTLPEEGTFLLIKDNVVYYSLSIKVKDGAYKLRIENMHKAYAAQSSSGTNYYDFELNNYNPNRHKSKKLKRLSMKELNIAHTYVTKDINRFKKFIEDNLTSTW